MSSKKTVTKNKKSTKDERQEERVEKVKLISSKKDVIVPVLVGAIVVAAFLVGFLFGKVSVYERLGVSGETKTAKTTDTTGAEPETSTVTIDQVKSLFSDKQNITFGDSNRKVLFIEFSDPSCPYCHIAAGMNSALNKEAGDRFILKQDGGTYVAPVPEMKKLVDEGKAGYVWMYSPGHGNGELATQVLYCAKDQNKFWEVHDLVMSSKGYELLNDTVKNDVKSLGLLTEILKPVVDVNKLTKCVEGGTYSGRVKNDEAVSQTFGVSGTPSFFINTENFAGAYSYVEMQSVVDAALK